MPVSDDLWNYIDSQISNKKERPRYWLFFFVSLVLLPSFYLGYKVISDNTETSLIALIKNSEPDNYSNENSDNLNLSNLGNFKLQLSNLNKIGSIRSKSIERINNKKQGLSFQIITEKNNSIDEIVDNIPSKEYKNLKPLALLKSNNKGNLITTQENENLLFKYESLAGTPQCPSFSGKSNKLYAYLSGTANYPFQFLNDKGGENNLYIDSRKSTESGFLSFSFDAGLGYQLNDRLFIQAGIMYNQINMKFHLIEEGQTRNSVLISRDTILNSNGDIIKVDIDTFINQEVGIEETLTLNKFKQLDIPLSIGYRLPLSRRLNVSMSGGVVFNLKTMSTGTILDAKGETLDFGNNITDGPLYSTKVGLSYTGAIKLETEVYPDLFVNAGIDLRYYGGYFNSIDNPIDQKYLSIGLGTGLRYKF